MASADVQVQEDIVRKATPSTRLDKDGIKNAYSEVRDDKSEVIWAVFKYEGNHIVVYRKGKKFEDFKAQFDDDDRAFAYLRLQTGDEMSRRSKFMMITWVGCNVQPIKRAKMSTDKAFIKEILVNIALELTVESVEEIDEEAFIKELNKATGTNYGTGSNN